MTPVPPRAEEPTVKVEEADSDLAQYEREGWSVGFDVEFHGTGIEVVAVNESDSSFSSDDEDDEDNESKDESAESGGDDPYAGYQRVPINVSADQVESGSSEEKCVVTELEKSNQFPAYVPPKVKAEFDKLLTSPPVYEHDKQMYIPNDIPLDEEKTLQIKKAMAGFTLQPNESFNTKDLLSLVQKMTQK
ncbi:unnamed protein product [Auanema sp. JU1783]|nr:unnamed protein product [Auanema sp. JU1783]